jgi:hypothetical protein
MRLTWVRAIVVSLIALLPAWAAAQDFPEDDPPRLTDRGRTLLSGAVGGWYSPEEESPTRWSVEVRPAFLRFVVDHLAIGGYLNVGAMRRDVLVLGPYGPTERVKTVNTRAGGGVQVLYEVELASNMGLVLSSSLGTDWTQSTSDPSYATLPRDTRRHLLQVGLTAPLLFHLSDAVGVGFGPFAALDYIIEGATYDDGPLSTRFGVTSAIYWSF